MKRRSKSAHKIEVQKPKGKEKLQALTFDCFDSFLSFKQFQKGQDQFAIRYKSVTTYK